MLLSALPVHHYAYGSILEWTYRYAAGMEPMEPGWKSVRLQPNPDPRLDRMDASYHSVSGSVKSAWCYWEWRGFLFPAHHVKKRPEYPAAVHRIRPRPLPGHPLRVKLHGDQRQTVVLHRLNHSALGPGGGSQPLA